MNDPSQAQARLDSWKAIADYLQRDVATARRWEKNLALPVHRVGGVGRSVFANPDEIDEWLNRSGGETGVHAAPVAAGASTHRPRALLRIAAVIAVLVVAALYVGLRPAVIGLNVAVTDSGFSARDAAGVEQWRRDFARGYQTAVPPAPVFVSGSKSPDVYLATSYRWRHNEDRVESGSLELLDARGRLRQSFSFGDRVSFHGQSYHEPWALSSYAVNDSGAVAITGHHYTWDPGLLTVLDAGWRRRGTFVHAGWIEHVRWLDHERLVIGGFSNAHDGGMVALLDAAALDGQGPEPPGSRHHCDTCAPGGPLKMVVIPRSELNRLSGSPFNRVLLMTGGDRVSVRSIEMPALRGDADAIYEFTTSLDLVSARFSDRYWEMHATLEADGRIGHARDACPDRDGPKQFLMWEPAGGWRTVRIR